MPDTVHRLIKTLRLIPRPPRKTEASEIRRRLETDGFVVTLRTVQRDLNHLAVHFPIRGDANKPQGWCWSGDPILIPVLDPQSALTLKLVEQFLQPLLPSATLQSLAEQFASAGKALSNSSRLAAWPRKVRAVPRAFPLLPPKIDPKVQATIYEGLLENRQVSIQYRSRDCGEPKEHTIHPLGIVIRDQLVYLVCTFYDYDDVRQLALHRIEAAHLLPDKASRPKHFNLDEYIEEGAFSYPVTGKRIRFRALFGAGAAEHLYETPLAKDQKLTPEKDGRVLVEATVLDSSALRWWILGFGASVEVLSPPELRQEFEQMASDLAALYGPGLS